MSNPALPVVVFSERLRILERSASAYGAYMHDIAAHLAEIGCELLDTCAEAMTHGKSALFLGDDDDERALARDAGCRLCPSPALAVDMAGGQRIHYICVPDESPVPLMQPGLGLAELDRHAGEIYAIASDSAVTEFERRGLHPEILGAADMPATSRTYRILDTQTQFPPEYVLRRGGHHALLALPLDVAIDTLPHPDGGHGAIRRLRPCDAIAPPLPADESLPVLNAADLAALEAIRAEVLGPYVDRYSGRVELSPGRKIISRYALHADNEAVVEQLVADLRPLGLTVTCWAYPAENRCLYDVVVERPADVGTTNPELVILGAHLDSCAGRQNPNYKATRDPAPGANDDASGMAALLVIARVIATIPGPLRRTIRLVFFNGEEVGMGGSQCYAKHLLCSGAAVRAMFQLDMIGRTQPKTADWQIHGSLNLYGSSRLVERLHCLWPVVSPRLGAPRLLFGAGDYAESSSDHKSFTSCGYPAVLVCEKDLPNGICDPKGDPDYHTERDRTVDCELAANIARIVAAAALTYARG